MKRLIILVLLISLSIATALANGCWYYSCSDYPSNVYTNVSYNYAATSQSFDSSRLLMCNNYDCTIVFEGARYHRLYVETPINLTVETLMYDVYGSDWCAPGHFGSPRLYIYYSGNYGLPNLAMGSNGAYTYVYVAHQESNINCRTAPHSMWIKWNAMLTAKGYYWIVPLRGTSNMKFSINMQSSCTPAYLNQSRCVDGVHKEKIINNSCGYEWKTIENCSAKNYNETEYYCSGNLIKQRIIYHTFGCSSNASECAETITNEEKVIQDCSEYNYNDEELYCDNNNLMTHITQHNYTCNGGGPIVLYSASSSKNMTFSCEEQHSKPPIAFPMCPEGMACALDGKTPELPAVPKYSDGQLVEVCEDGCNNDTCLNGTNATFGFLPVAGTVDSKGAQGSDASTILFGGLATAAIAGGAAGTAMAVRSIKGRGNKPFSISVIQQSIDKIGKSLDNVAKAALPPLPPFENIPFVSRRAEFEAQAIAEYEAERARVQQEAEWRRIDRMQRAQDVADRQALELQMQQDAINDQVWLANYRAEQQRNQPVYRDAIPRGPCMIDGMPADTWTAQRIASNDIIRNAGGIPPGYDYNPNSGILTQRPPPPPTPIQQTNNTISNNSNSLFYSWLNYQNNSNNQYTVSGVTSNGIRIQKISDGQIAFYDEQNGICRLINPTGLSQGLPINNTSASGITTALTDGGRGAVAGTYDGSFWGMIPDRNFDLNTWFASGDASRFFVDYGKDLLTYSTPFGGVRWALDDNFRTDWTLTRNFCGANMSYCIGYTTAEIAANLPAPSGNAGKAAYTILDPLGAVLYDPYALAGYAVINVQGIINDVRYLYLKDPVLQQALKTQGPSEMTICDTDCIYRLNPDLNTPLQPQPQSHPTPPPED